MKLLPRIGFATAILVIGIGIAKLSGKVIHLNISSAKFFLRDNNKYGLKINYRYFFLIGIGYATISINCTVPLFPFLISQGIFAGSLTQGPVIFLTYSLGIGTIMTIISVSLSISNQTFAKLYSTK